ncbi:MAG: roadblock/LC7 domain-containing protein [Verrucomicrobiota bacterium]
MDAAPTPSPRYNPAVNPTPPQVASPQAAGTTTFVVSLLSLAEGWPEAVRKEIVQTNLIDAKLTSPPDAIDRALKQGRIAFTWQTLRSWIKPAPMNATSAHGDLVLELPLKIVAPLFLARQQELHKEHKKVAIDEEIPNLFYGSPENAAGPSRVEPNSKASDTSHILRTAATGRDRHHDTGGNTPPAPRAGSAPGHATPNELVARASALDGVAGALIALPDGLMVASKLSPGLNGDTLAAFLPQIFAKVNQCTKELCMGELNNLHFTMDNVPWQIFRVQSVFFAAFGREGKTLPTAQLAALAADLEHRLS